VEGEFRGRQAGGKRPESVNYDWCPRHYSDRSRPIGPHRESGPRSGGTSKIGTFPFAANGKARILNLPEGMVKGVAEKKYDEVLGVHIIGPRATELISDACSLLKLETTSGRCCT